MALDREALLAEGKSLLSLDIPEPAPILQPAVELKVGPAPIETPTPEEQSFAEETKNKARDIVFNTRLWKIEPFIKKAADETGLDPNLIKEVIRAESNGNPKAVSRVGAKGLMQLMDETAETVGVEDPFNPEQNIMGGARYLKNLLDTFGGDEEKALAAYNAGPTAVRKYDGVPPYKETQNYVDKIKSRRDTTAKPALDRNSLLEEGRQLVPSLMDTVKPAETKLLPPEQPPIELKTPEQMQDRVVGMEKSKPVVGEGGIPAFNSEQFKIEQKTKEELVSPTPMPYVGAGYVAPAVKAEETPEEPEIQKPMGIPETALRGLQVGIQDIASNFARNMAAHERGQIEKNTLGKTIIQPETMDKIGEKIDSIISPETKKEFEEIASQKMGLSYTGAKSAVANIAGILPITVYTNIMHGAGTVLGRGVPGLKQLTGFATSNAALIAHERGAFIKDANRIGPQQDPAMKEDWQKITDKNSLKYAIPTGTMWNAGILVNSVTPWMRFLRGKKTIPAGEIAQKLTKGKVFQKIAGKVLAVTGLGTALALSTGINNYVMAESIKEMKTKYPEWEPDWQEADTGEAFKTGIQVAVLLQLLGIPAGRYRKYEGKLRKQQEEKTKTAIKTGLELIKEETPTPVETAPGGETRGVAEAPKETPAPTPTPIPTPETPKAPEQPKPKTPLEQHKEQEKAKRRVKSTDKRIANIEREIKALKEERDRADEFDADAISDAIMDTEKKLENAKKDRGVAETEAKAGGQGGLEELIIDLEKEPFKETDIPEKPLVVPEGTATKSPEDAEKAWDAQHGSGGWLPSFREKVKSKLKQLANYTREFADLDEKVWGKAIDLLRVFKAAPEYSRLTTEFTLGKITESLNKENYKVFEKYIVLRDAVRNAERFPDAPTADGYKNAAERKTDFENWKKIAEANPEVMKAIETNDRVFQRLRNDLVRYGFDTERILNGTDYFHRQILEKMAENQTGYVGGTGTGLKQKKAGFEKRRTASGQGMAYNKDYYEAMGEVINQTLLKIQKAKAREKIAEWDKYPELANELMAEGEGRGNMEKRIRAIMPEGYEFFRIDDKRNPFYEAFAINDKKIAAILEGSYEPKKGDFKKVLAVGKAPRPMVIPTELANALRNFDRPNQMNLVTKGLNSVQNKWKQWVLLNPFGVIKYNINNLSGDFDIVLASNPGILKYVGKSAKDLWDFNLLKYRNNPELMEGVKRGIVEGGMTFNEIPDIGKSEFLNVLSGKKPSLIKRYWNTIKNFTQWRENVLRLAAWRYFREKVVKEGRTDLYGASNAKLIDAMKGDKEAYAAKLSRDLIGDYGGISEAGQWLRRTTIPFFSWMEINAPRYYRLLQNTKIEGEAGGKLKLAGVGGLKVGRKNVTLGAKAAILYAAVNLWNETFYPEENRMVNSYNKELYLILPGSGSGSDQVHLLRIQGALSDMLSWVGGQNLVGTARELQSGTKTASDVAGDAFKSIFSKPLQAVGPQYKLIAEGLSGMKFYPDITHPTPIRDYGEWAAGNVALKGAYNFAAGKPSQSGNWKSGQGIYRAAKNILGTVVYTKKKGELSYNRIKELESSFMKEKGKERRFNEPSEKSNALYEFKKAEKLKDTAAASKYLIKYMNIIKKETGEMPTQEEIKANIAKSIKGAEPMFSIPNEMRDEFKNWLPAEDRAELYRSQKYYDNIFGNAENIRIPYIPNRK